MYVSEYKKRGLTHAHILVWLADVHKLKTTEDIDSIICAELPPDHQTFPEGSSAREQAERLEQIIVKQMRHGPCGAENTDAPCMFDKDGNKMMKCQKGFPKPFREETEWDDLTCYPLYRRRNNGRVYIDSKGFHVDNRYIVPYSPYLCLRYNAHINVEAATSATAAKYLFKYIHKGGDRSMVRVEGNVRNEIDEYQDMRSVGSNEACWRFFEFPISERHPAVYDLIIHLPGQQLFRRGKREGSCHARCFY